MIRLASLIAVAMSVLALFSAGPALAEPNDGTISGQVVNRTAGGGSTEGASVVLVAFGRKEQAPLGQRTTQADATGHYAFSGLDRDPNIVYITLARYQSVNYPTDTPLQLQDQSTGRADIVVYDTTSADDAIQFESLNMLVMGADQGIVQCMEMGALVNSGDHTFVTANPQDQALARAIKFPLPSGAVGIQMQTGFSQQDLIQGVGGVQVTSPVPPGRHQFALSFQIPYTSSSTDLSLQMPYTTGSFSVYVPQGGGAYNLNNTSLSAIGPTQLGGQPYSLFSTSNLPKAALVAGQLSGLGGSTGAGTNQLAMISLGVVLFVVGGGALLFGGRLRPRLEKAAKPLIDGEQERLELVVRMAALDERYAAGEVSEADYLAERERGKQRLRELTLARRQPTVSGA